MHSGHGGRGEETPEMREGTALPAQNEPWDAAQAGGGHPWGQPQPQQSYSPFDGYGPPPAQPLPDGDATQMFPPYPQMPAPGAGPGAADATQMLPPYPQTMPPPMAEATQHLPRFDQYAGGYEAQQAAPPQDDFAHLYQQPQQPQQAQPLPQAVPPQVYDMQPPIQAPAYAPAAAPQRKKLSPVALVAIVVCGCALAGLAAGAVLSGGGSDTQASAGSSPSASAGESASSSATSGSSGGDSGAKGQAEKLDALLKQSGSSRASVVSAVTNIQSCNNLDQAATALRAAATQRQGLVSSLASLSVDQLPDHQELTDALTKAWNASASADTHYAAWADQAARDKKVCRSGRARSTGQRTAGDKSSVTATAQKGRAVSLWNSIAGQYGLSRHQASEL